jgi:hypothetical protein
LYLASAWNHKQWLVTAVTSLMLPDLLYLLQISDKVWFG